MVHVEFDENIGWVVREDETETYVPYHTKHDAVEAAKHIAITKKNNLHIHNKTNTGGRIIDFESLDLRLNRRLKPLKRTLSEALQEDSSSNLVSDVGKVYGFAGMRTDETIELQERNNELSVELDKINITNKVLNRDLHEVIYKHQQGIPRQSIKEIQYLPVTVYLSDTKDEEKISLIISNFLDVLNIEFSDEYTTEYGSVFKRWWAATKDKVLRIDLKREQSKAVRSINNRLHNKIQSEINKNNADAMSSLITAIENDSNGIMTAGTIMVAKSTDEHGNTHIVAKELTDDEIMDLEEQNYLLKKPSEIIKKLDSE